MPIIKQCTWCGKEIKVSPSKNSKHNFCNKECYLAFHTQNTKEYNCEVCGKKFKSSQHQNANRFCSRECYNKFHNIQDKERICPTCGKIFIARTSEDKYCSQECHLKQLHSTYKDENHWNWQGGISKENDRHDSNEYKQWRSQVYQRDNYKCTKCGSKHKINAHHIYSWSNYPELRYDIKNGVTLCEECHIKIHQKYGYDSKERMI